MQNFPVLTIDTAPGKSKLALQALQGAFGMIPNVAGTMATSPVLIDSLVGLFGKVHGGSFTEAQIQTLLLTNAVTNGCSWAVALRCAVMPATDCRACARIAAGAVSGVPPSKGGSGAYTM